MQTVRRDILLAMARAGKLVKVGSYHYDEMTGEERTQSEIPVRVKSCYEDYKEGFCNLIEFDFQSKSGHAYLNDNGTIHLYVHSNCSFDFRLADGVEATIGGVRLGRKAAA